MEYQIYKLHFSTAVHIGDGNLTDGLNIICADTMFSALCHEALRFSGDTGIRELIDLARNHKLQISDLFPFIGEELYIPKPLCPVQIEQEGDSLQKKKFKKLKYIPITQINTYLEGKLDPENESEKIKYLGQSAIRTMSSSVDPEKALTGDMLPYNVGIYRFQQGNGLYMIAAFENKEIREKLECFLEALSFSGIGGKRSAGFGRFSIEKCETPAAIKERLAAEHYHAVTLSVSMAKEEELGQVLEDAQYLLARRAGFVASDTYAETMKRKRDFYVFRSGSCFSHTFSGDVYDVSDGGGHPVYRYAIPMFMEV